MMTATTTLMKMTAGKRRRITSLKKSKRNEVKYATTLVGPKRKYLFIGGYPKGYEEAFSICSHSGKILWGLVRELGLTALAFDLWEDDIEERKGYIFLSEREQLENFRKEGFTLIALGKHVANSCLKAGIKVEYMPHPARHSKLLKQRLLEKARETDV